MNGPPAWPRALVLAGFLAGLTGSMSAARAYVDLELVLAVDISRSMDFDELKLQRDGYVGAFQHPEVLNAIQTGPNGRIAVVYVEWAGANHQSVVVPWTVIAGSGDAFAFAEALAAAPVVRERGTSISGALEFASGLFPSSGVTGLRRAIDISGDGPNNEGRPIVPTRDRIVAEGISINGLPLMLKPVLSITAYSIPDLDIYYEDCVIGGPGAFSITVDDPAHFAAAVRRKLVLEIAGIAPVEGGEARVVPASELRPEPRIDCLIGEKARGLWILD